MNYKYYYVQVPLFVILIAKPFDESGRFNQSSAGKW